jgi:hypothetical protein
MLSGYGILIIVAEIINFCQFILRVQLLCTLYMKILGKLFAILINFCVNFCMSLSAVLYYFRYYSACGRNKLLINVKYAGSKHSRFDKRHLAAVGSHPVRLYVAGPPHPHGRLEFRSYPMINLMVMRSRKLTVAMMNQMH